MNKLINEAATLVGQSLAGMVRSQEGRLRLDAANRLVVRADAPRPGKVGLVSGGGAGHEPLHAGYVGRGMLDAACCGEVFTSPVPDQVLAATLAVDAGAGVLHVVKNYTGDVLNFEMAQEMAAERGVRVASVVVADDASGPCDDAGQGRRGLALTVLLEKVLGAAAEQGAGLEELLTLAERVRANGRSMGVALGSATVPSVGRPTFELAPGQMELGVGLHGEPGRERRPLPPAREVTRLLLDPVLAELDPTDDGVLVLVNGLGATPLAELHVVFDEVVRRLDGLGIRVVRSLVGNHATALDMAGCSVTLLCADAEIVSLWDQPVHTAALRWGC